MRDTDTRGTLNDWGSTIHGDNTFAVQPEERIKSLLQRLEAAADPATRAWFERYLRYAINYRGVRTPMIRRLMITWYAEAGIAVLPLEEQLVIAATLIGQSFAEDKFAGTMMIQKYLLQRAAPEDILAISEVLFAEGAFYDWSTTDWFCVRVLGPILKGRQGGARIASWKGCPNLWQRRSAIVPFTVVVDDPFHDALVKDTIAVLVKEKERFIQTGVGWVIASLAKARPKVAEQIVEQHLGDLSAEVIRRHTKRLPKYEEYRRAKARR